jgi:hypothetical protein
MAKGICSGCGQIFNSESVHALHRTGSFGDPIYGKNKQIVGYTPSERQCLTDVQMYTRGLTRNDKGWWVTSLYDESIRNSRVQLEQESTLQGSSE